MVKTNRFISIVRIIETPKILSKGLSLQFRVQIPTRKKGKIIIANLAVWGTLVDKVKKYYKINDYIVIEGFPSLSYISEVESNKQKSKAFKQFKIVQVTVSKIYPFLLQLDKKSATLLI